MYIWIVQPFEPTPIDNKGEQRLIRVGILADLLVKKGHKVLWWTSDFDHKNLEHRHNSSKRIKINDSYSIQFIKSLGYKKNISIRRIINNSLLAFHFKSLIKSERDKPDIILASIPLSELAFESAKFAKKYKIPLVIDIRDLWPDAFFDVIPKYFKSISFLINFLFVRTLKKACKAADAITGITDAFVEWGLVKANRRKTSKDQSFFHGYIKPVLEEKEYKEGIEFWRKFNITENSNYFYVSYLGVLGQVYDFKTIVDAAKIVSNNQLPIKFIICGKGPKLNKLKSLSQDLDSLIIPGWIYKKQLKTLLKISHLGIAPYRNIHSFTNTISNKVAEYLSTKLPIALSIDNGLLFQKITRYDAGFSYSEDPKKLVDSIMSLKNNQNYYARMKSNAFNFYNEELNANKIYDDFANYLEKLSL